MTLAAHAQPAPEPPAADGDELIELNLPEQVELRVFIALVSDQLDINVVYDEQVAGKRVSIRAPEPVPADSLRGLLESALRMKGLVMVPGEAAGWFKIVSAPDLTAVSRPAGGDDADAVAVTEVFRLEHASPTRTDQVIAAFLSKPGGNSVVYAEQRSLIVTDYATNLPRVRRLVELLDRPGPPVEVAYVPVKTGPVNQVAGQLRQVLMAKERAAGPPGGGGAGAAIPGAGVQVLEEARTNQLILVGSAEAVAEARELVEPLDLPLGLETKIYRFATAPPGQVDALVRELIGPVSSERLYRSAVDSQWGLLVVSTTPQIHEEVTALQADFDLQIEEASPVIEFYKLQNATAVEVLQTIQQIEGGRADALAAVEGFGGAASAGPASGGGQGQELEQTADQLELRPRPEDESEIGAIYRPPVRETPDSVQPIQGIVTPGARVVADPNTNTLIVLADATLQAKYKSLIERLDKRRPQVLVEVTIVTLDTSDGFSLGVEYSQSTDNRGARELTFSQFGLSEVDVDTGQLTIEPGLGFNGVVVASDVVEIVIRALATTGRADVRSAPKILINDNATGRLNAVQDQPFASVNASQTVSTTTFGGFEDAGTSIAVTPQISEGDHLKLAYSISLSAFNGEGSETVPPPRQRNEIESVVTIPHGDTIVVGGLNLIDRSETINKIPFLGDIPVLEYLFSSRNITNRNATLFVFIKPTILRDDKFKDLKFLSVRDRQAADLPETYPTSKPVLVR